MAPKMAPKSPLGGVWGPSCAILAPRWLQEAKRTPKVRSRTPPGPPKLEPKSAKNRSESHPKCDHFFDCFLDRFLKQLGAKLDQLGAQNGAKLAPSWAQNRAQEAIQEQLAKIVKISTTLERELNFERFWAPKLAQKSINNRSKKQ